MCKMLFMSEFFLIFNNVMFILVAIERTCVCI